MTEPDLFISAMQVDDLPEVMLIEQKCYDFPWSEELLRNCLKVGYHALVLREEGCVRAYAFASSGAGESHILNICVDPEFRGQGYAKTLLKQCIATVMIHGAKVMFLEVRESNRGAISLYESMGFVEIGRRDNYYRRQTKKSGNAEKGRSRTGKSKKNSVTSREDALVMSRDLTVIADENDF